MKILGLDREKVKEYIRNGKVTFAVYGLGKMGLPLAAVLAEHGGNVIGVDINEDVVRTVNKGISHIKEEPGLDVLVKRNVEAGRLSATTNVVYASKTSDVMIIIIPTLVDEKGNLKLGNIFSLAEEISKGLDRGDIVITESTMPPGTTEKLIPLLEKSGLKLGEFGLAHAPERTMSGTAIRDITEQYPKIIGADDPRTLEAVAGIYETINKKGVIPMSSIKAAEAVKVFEGIYRDVNIALANELALWCEEHGLDALEIFRTANTQPYCHLHMPGAGVGGHCIPVYPWFVINLAKNVNPRLIKTAREINDYMPRHIVELTVKALNNIQKPLSGSNILVLGLTFRGGVKEFRKSPAIEIIRELKKWKAKVYVYDPICDSNDAMRFGAIWKDNFKDIDVIIIATDHKEFRKLDLSKISKEVRNKIIIDGRNMLNKETVLNAGFYYLRVGLSYTDPE
ncbi:MAG: nucleotide sugar dehydrogenase [Thermoproteota archaeon]|nr:MAG: nucleotide sugar dehydrogenase [Candidatus Korarchaeota archaeon]